MRNFSCELAMPDAQVFQLMWSSYDYHQLEVLRDKLDFLEIAQGCKDVFFGLFLICAPGAMITAHNAYAPMLQWAPQWVWGCCCMLIGIIRWLATASEFQPLRRVGAFFACGFWGELAYNVFIFSSRVTIGCFGWLSLLIFNLAVWIYRGEVTRRMRATQTWT